MSYVPAQHRRSGYHFHPVPARDAFEAARRKHLVALASVVRDGTFTAAEAFEEVAATQSASLQLVQIELEAKVATPTIARRGERS